MEIIEYLNRPQALELLGISPEAFRTAIRRGVIPPAVRHGDRDFWRRAEIQAVIDHLKRLTPAEDVRKQLRVSTTAWVVFGRMGVIPQGMWFCGHWRFTQEEIAEIRWNLEQAGYEPGKRGRKRIVK